MLLQALKDQNHWQVPAWPRTKSQHWHHSQRLGQRWSHCHGLPLQWYPFSLCAGPKQSLWQGRREILVLVSNFITDSTPTQQKPDVFQFKTFLTSDLVHRPMLWYVSQKMSVIRVFFQIFKACLPRVLESSAIPEWCVRTWPISQRK